MTSVAYIVNIHGAHSYRKQGALGAAGVRDGLQLGRIVRRTAGVAILCRHAHSLLEVVVVVVVVVVVLFLVLFTEMDRCDSKPPATS